MAFSRRTLSQLEILERKDLDSIFSATEKIIGLDPNQRREIARAKHLGISSLSQVLELV